MNAEWLVVSLWATGIFILCLKKLIFPMKTAGSGENIDNRTIPTTAFLQPPPNISFHSMERIVFAYINEVLPAIYSNKFFSWRLWIEFCRHHRYIKLFLTPTGNNLIVEIFRLLNLWTFICASISVFLMAYIEDDGIHNKCNYHLTEASCMHRKIHIIYPFSGPSLCEWSSSSQCGLRSMELSVQLHIALATVVSCVCGFAMILLESLFNILRCPSSPAVPRKYNCSTCWQNNKIREDGGSNGKREEHDANSFSSIAGGKQDVMLVPQRVLIARAKAVQMLGIFKEQFAHVIRHPATASITSIPVMKADSLHLTNQYHQQQQKQQQQQSSGFIVARVNGSPIKRLDEMNAPHEVHARLQPILSGGPRPHRAAAGVSTVSLHDTPLKHDTVGVEVQQRTAEVVAPRVRIESSMASAALAVGSTGGTNETKAAVLALEDYRVQARIFYKKLRCAALDHRLQLHGKSRDVFDQEWGFDSDHSAFYAEIVEQMAFAIQRAELLIKSMVDMSDTERGIVLMQQWISDIVGPRILSSKIIQHKFQSEFVFYPSVNVEMQIASCFILLVTNALLLWFVFAVVLSVPKNETAWHSLFVELCWIQLIVEICVVSTVQWFISHILTSNSIFEIVRQAMWEFEFGMLRLKHANDYFLVHMESNIASLLDEFNAPAYMFASCRVADAYPALLESNIVKCGRSVYVHNLSKQWRRNRNIPISAALYCTNTNVGAVVSHNDIITGRQHQEQKEQFSTTHLPSYEKEEGREEQKGDAHNASIAHPSADADAARPQLQLLHGHLSRMELLQQEHQKDLSSLLHEQRVDQLHSHDSIANANPPFAIINSPATSVATINTNSTILYRQSYSIQENAAAVAIARQDACLANAVVLSISSAWFSRLVKPVSMLWWVYSLFPSSYMLRWLALELLSLVVVVAIGVAGFYATHNTRSLIILLFIVWSSVFVLFIKHYLRAQAFHAQKVITECELLKLKQTISGWDAVVDIDISPTTRISLVKNDNASNIDLETNNNVLPENYESFDDNAVSSEGSLHSSDLYGSVSASEDSDSNGIVMPNQMQMEESQALRTRLRSFSNSKGVASGDDDNSSSSSSDGEMEFQTSYQKMSAVLTGKNNSIAAATHDILCNYAKFDDVNLSASGYIAAINQGKNVSAQNKRASEHPSIALDVDNIYYGDDDDDEFYESYYRKKKAAGREGDAQAGTGIANATAASGDKLSSLKAEKSVVSRKKVSSIKSSVKSSGYGQQPRCHKISTNTKKISKDKAQFYAEKLLDFKVHNNRNLRNMMTLKTDSATMMKNHKSTLALKRSNNSLFDDDDGGRRVGVGAGAVVTRASKKHLSSGAGSALEQAAFSPTAKVGAAAGRGGGSVVGTFGAQGGSSTRDVSGRGRGIGKGQGRSNNMTSRRILLAEQDDRAKIQHQQQIRSSKTKTTSAHEHCWEGNGNDGGGGGDAGGQGSGSKSGNDIYCFERDNTLT